MSVIRKPDEPAMSRPGNLTYELDAGRHVWRLEVSGCNLTFGPHDVDDVKAWASLEILSGRVDGIPIGTTVLAWDRETDETGEWMSPSLGPCLGPDWDRDRRIRATGTGTAPPPVPVPMA